MLEVATIREDRILPAARLLLGVCLLTLALQAPPAAAVGAAEGGVRGFIVGGRLNAWCTREDPLDVEACYSYLRAVFDTLATLGAEGAGATVACIPDRISIGELRTVVTRYLAADAGRLRLQAALVVREALADGYDCE